MLISNTRQYAVSLLRAGPMQGLHMLMIVLHDKDVICDADLPFLPCLFSVSVSMNSKSPLYCCASRAFSS